MNVDDSEELVFKYIVGANGELINENLDSFNEPCSARLLMNIVDDDKTIQSIDTFEELENICDIEIQENGIET